MPVYDEQGKLQSAGGGGATNLDGLSDVAITTAAQGDVLMRNATQFVNTNIAEQRVVGRLTGEDVKGLTAAELSALLSLSTTYVQLSLFDANTVLAATADNTPAAVTIAEQTVLGRATGGNITALAIDSDLTSVSANDDTVPSAKATKAALDGKAATSHQHAASDITSGALLLERGGTEADLSATGPGAVIQASAGAALSILKHNLAGTTAPGANDDTTQGYAVGSQWCDTTNDKVYICIDASAGAAIWRQIGLDSNAIHSNVSGEINALTEKASPVSGDLIVIEDSAASNAKKKVQIGNLPGGGSSTFTGLSDVPSSYSGQGGNLVRVNSGATALEFVSSQVVSAPYAIVSNSSSLSDLCTLTIPANRLGSTGGCLVEGAVIVKNSSGTNGTYNLGYSIAGTDENLYTGGVINTGSARSVVWFTINVQNANATNAQLVLAQTHRTDNAAAAAALGPTTQYLDWQTFSADTTADVAIKIRVQLSAAHANFAAELVNVKLILPPA